MPVYIVADVFINRLRAANQEILLSKLPKDYHHLIFPFKMETQFKRDLMGAIPIILALYL